MLDADQQKIVDLPQGILSVVATAGSGKSTVLLHRTGRLYDQGKLVCLTFTNESAKNLRTRSSKLFPHVDVNCFSTLHALALKFAYRHPDSFPFQLADTVLAEEGVSARCVFDSIGDSINFRAFTTWVSLQKRNRVSATDAVREAERTGKKLDYAIGFKRYETSKRKLGLLDFDDLLTYFCDILETRPDIRSEWQYTNVLVDEAQDLSELDWRIIQLLSEKHTSVTAVGDAGQSIYGFRGANSIHLLEMDKYFPGTQQLVMGSNYRSLPGIVEFGKKAYPYPDIAKSFRAVRDGEIIPPSVTMYSTDYREAEDVIKKIQHYTPNECAILARTNLALRSFEEAALDAGVDYHVLGDSGFWESQEVKNVLFYVRCATMLSDNAILGAIKTPFWPTKYLKKKVVTEKIKSRLEHGESAWTALSHIPEVSGFRNFIGSLFQYQYLPAEDAVRKIVKDLKAVEHYSDEDGINPDRNPVANLKELARAAGRYQTLSTFLDFLRKVSYSKKSRKGVCLSTIHAFKGKEIENVFLVSCNQGILPHSKSENLEEEKCCFFVGCSRPKDSLHISYYGQPSQFLEPWLKEKDNEQKHTFESVYREGSTCGTDRN